MTLAWIALDGAAGAVSRCLLQGWVDGLSGGQLPWGTFVISGSLALGVLFALAVDRALLVRIYIGESDHHDGRPLYGAIVQPMRRCGLAGATVLRGVEGLGRYARVHTMRIPHLSSDLPILIEAVDEEVKVRAALPELDAMVGEGLITLEKVDVIAYRSPDKEEGS